MKRAKDGGRKAPAFHLTAIRLTRRMREFLAAVASATDAELWEESPAEVATRRAAGGGI